MKVQIYLMTIGAAFILAMLFFTSESRSQSSANRIGKIAFSSTRDGNVEIYTMDSDGRNHRRLTDNPGIDDHATWSPDGKKIAFLSQDLSGTFALKMMNADGSAQEILTFTDQDHSPYHWHCKNSLSWSPDGTRIAFQQFGEIYVIDVDGSNLTNLTKHPAWDAEPSWSPDGSRIIFASSRVSWRVLHTMKPDGSDVQQLPTEGEYWDMSPNWSPDGKKFVFVAHHEEGLPILNISNSDGSGRELFRMSSCNPICSEHMNRPVWAPDGKRIVFHTWEYFSNDAEIYVKDVEGGGTVQLTNVVGNNFTPSLQTLPVMGSISGRVLTPDNKGLRNATLSLTDASGNKRTTVTSSLGFFSFDNLSVGVNYFIRVSSRRYRFAIRQLLIDDNLSDVDLVGLE